MYIGIRCSIDLRTRSWENSNVVNTFSVYIYLGDTDTDVGATSPSMLASPLEILSTKQPAFKYTLQLHKSNNRSHRSKESWSVLWIKRAGMDGCWPASRSLASTVQNQTHKRARKQVQQIIRSVPGHISARIGWSGSDACDCSVDL